MASEYLTNIKNAVTTIFEGMAVTLSWMFRKPVTIQYPDRAEPPVEKTIPERSRGILEVDLSACIGDLQCMRTCPIGAIQMEMGKNSEGVRTINRFDIDISHCMYCGLCTEVCPTNAIRHTREFEVCSRNINNLKLKFVTNPVVPYKLQKDSPAPTTPNGSELKKVLKEWDAED